MGKYLLSNWSMIMDVSKNLCCALERKPLRGEETLSVTLNV